MDSEVTADKAVPIKQWIQKPDCLKSERKVKSRNGINEV